MPSKTANTTPSKRFYCRHVYTDGRRCGSPSLREEKFCYYHHNTRGAAARAAARSAIGAGFNLPVLEDQRAIQQSLHQVIQKVASNELDPRRAGLILYGLQIAAQTIRKDTPDEDELAPPVDEITVDPELGDLAPDDEYREA